MRMLIVIVVLLALGAGVWVWYWHFSSNPNIEFRTAEITRGDLLSTISATGTIEPEEVVDVGAQVAGLITEFGKDANGKLVDYRSPVEGDMILAKIDDAVYRADYDTAIAQLEQAKANVQKAQADHQQAEAQLYQAKRNWERAAKIGPSDALSQNDYDMYKATYDADVANVAVFQAEIAQAVTGISQAKASVEKAKRNLDFCVIKSPVKGVIIDRRVNIGQTVVSSLNAPSLFLIAKDLTRMQIWVAVNEADIGHIHPDQNVTFTCDAFPGKPFNGTVGKVRLNATMTQNVVTYTVEVNIDNPEGKLLPYLTANVQFEVEKDPNVLMVPNAALRWYPTNANEVAPEARADWKPVEREEGPSQGGGNGAAEQSKPKVARDKKPHVRTGSIWVKDGEFVRPIPVKVGPTDGINTEVIADNLKEGGQIVVGEVIQSGQNAGEHNPFLPQMNRRGR